MGKLVHIVNGDSTAKALSKSALNGDVVVWREMLCEGPLICDIGSDNFWIKRYAFFESELNISKLNYYDTTIKEIIKIENISKYSEVVLWFEFDLFCQINLLGLCSYLLKHYRKDIKYYLVCTGIENDKNTLLSLSDYSFELYPELMRKRKSISRRDLLFAEECWRIFVNNNELELRTFDFKINAKFNYLHEAINQHLKRLPAKNGLNEIENKFLELIKFDPSTKISLIQKILSWQQKESVYGFGDLQYNLILDKMNELVEIKDEIYYLSEKGKALI